MRRPWRGLALIEPAPEGREAQLLRVVAAGLDGLRQELVQGLLVVGLGVAAQGTVEHRPLDRAEGEFFLRVEAEELPGESVGRLREGG